MKGIGNITTAKKQAMFLQFESFQIIRKQQIASDKCLDW
jgi:hypothetical protein